MANKQLVLAFFDSEAAADKAVNDLKAWDKANQDIKLGAIGVLVKDAQGKVKTHKLGSRKWGVGAILGAIAAVLSGGMTLVGGAVLGRLVGAFFHSGLGMSKEDLARIDKELDNGRAAVGVLANDNEAASVSKKLSELGGKAETHAVSDEAVQQATVAVQSAPEATSTSSGTRSGETGAPPP